MAKKTYRTYHLKGLQLLLCDEYGHQMEVTFRSGAQIDSTAKFTTSDENLQKTLESCSGFGRDYYIESVREDKPVAVETPADENVVDNAVEAPADENVVDNAVEASEPESNAIKVADKSEAIEWLKEHNPDAGYTAAKLRSKDAFEKACADCNVTFEFNA